MADHGRDSSSQPPSQQWQPPSAAAPDFSALQSIQSISNADLDALIQSYDQSGSVGGNANDYSALGGGRLEGEYR